MVGVALAAMAGLGTYWLVVRPWHLRWGATDEEVHGTLPGDELVAGAEQQVTHAITINASADRIWPWLVQMGQGRGGFYSYDRLESLFGLQIKNADRIRPELQDLKQGHFVRGAPPEWLGGRLAGKAGWHVVVLESDRALVLRSPMDNSTWAFVLKAIDSNTTRLLARVRVPARSRWATRALDLAVAEPAHFIMERKMLLTLKRLVEGTHRPTAPPIAV